MTSIHAEGWDVDGERENGNIARASDASFGVQKR
jgi:hypothetical protein